MKCKAVACIVTIMVFSLVSFANADWPILGSDIAHTCVGTSGPLSAPIQLWNYSTPGNPISSSPVVANGIVYMGLYDNSVGNWGSYVDALNGTNGALIWRFGKINSMSSPAVANGIVYIAGNFSVYALNATNGQFIWHFSDDNTAYTPTVSGGIVYFCSGHSYYALNAVLGFKIWNFTLNDSADSPAAVYDGILYLNVGGVDGMYALDAKTGVQIWSFKNTSGGSPAVANGVVYAGSPDYNFYAINAKTGVEIWNFKIDSQSWISGCSPAVANGLVYIGSSDGNMYALNTANGKVVWNYTAQPIWNSYTYSPAGFPAIGSGVIYFGSGAGAVYALNATSGAKLWNYTFPRYLDNGWAISSSPAIDNGVLYIGSFYGCLYALASSGAQTPVQPTPTPQSSNNNATPSATQTPAADNSTPTPNTTSTTIKAINNGANVTLNLKGNITSTQIKNAQFTTNQTENTTSLSFTLTGQNGDYGFTNITIAKSNLPYGTKPTVLIDNQKCLNQGYTQDNDNYYVWFTTHFSTHQVSIVFSSETQNTDSSIFTILVAIILIAILAVPLAYIAIKRTRKTD
jgi:outer membrane protein assembly factor BamB